MFFLSRVTGGELFDKIVELGAYTEADAAKLVHNMVKAIDYLHSKNIVHRDLKPENLLLKADTDISEVKLADFGLSKIISDGVQKQMMQTACGTPGYVGWFSFLCFYFYCFSNCVRIFICETK